MPFDLNDPASQEEEKRRLEASQNVSQQHVGLAEAARQAHKSATQLTYKRSADRGPVGSTTFTTWAQKRGYDPYRDSQPADRLLQSQNPFAFSWELQDKAKRWDTVEARLDEIERVTGGRLPTDMSLAMAESLIDKYDMHKAARLFARELQTPMANLFQPVKVGNRSVFINPQTNKPLSLEAARRLYKPYETRFYRSILKDSKVDPNQAAAWFRALSPLQGEDIPWQDAMSASIGMAEKASVGSVKAFRGNLRLLASDPELKDPSGRVVSGKGKIQIAFTAAQQGITLENGNDVITFLMGGPGPEPAPGTAEHAAWDDRKKMFDKWQGAQQSAKDQMAAAYQYATTKDQMVISTGTPDLAVEYKDGKYTLTDKASELPEDERLALENLVRGKSAPEESYQEMISRIQQQYMSDEDSFSNSILGHIVGPVGQVFDTAGDLVNATLYTVGSGLGIGLRGLAMPVTHETFDHLSWDAQRRLGNSAEMLFDQSGDELTLMEALSNDVVISSPDNSWLTQDGQVKPWVSLAFSATELSAQMALDPTNLLFGVGKLQKGAHLIEKADEVNDAISEMSAIEKGLRRLAGGSDTLLAPTWQGRVGEWLKVPQRKLGGSTVPQWLRDAAIKYSDNPMDFYDAVKAKFRDPKGGLPFPRILTDAIHEWTGTALEKGIRTSDELEGDIVDILATSMDYAPHRRPQAFQDILDGIKEGDRWGLNKPSAFPQGVPKRLGDGVAPHWQGWMTDADALKEGERFSKRIVDMFEAKPTEVSKVSIPTIRGSVSDLRAATWRATQNTFLGAGSRYRRSQLLSNAANLEKDFVGWTENYLNRAKGLYTPEEVAARMREAGHLTAPFADKRETRFIKFIERLGDEIVTRIAKKHGLSEVEVQHHLDEFRTGVRQLNGHMYGITDENIKDWQALLDDEGLHSVRDPKFATQLPNVWIAADPVRMEQMIQESIGYKKRVADMFAGIFGKDVGSDVAKYLATGDSGKLKPVTLNLLTNTFSRWTREYYMRWWKTAVVATPRYVLRVPMFDEQLRMIADMGALSFLGMRRSAGHAANVLEKVSGGRLAARTSIEFDLNDAKVLSELNERLSDAGFADLDDAVDALDIQKQGLGGDWLADQLDSLNEHDLQVLEDTLAARKANKADTIPKFKITLPRNGEIADESMANSSRLSSVFKVNEQQSGRFLERMRRFAKGKQSFWDEILPTDRGYSKSLAHVLINQVERDEVGRRALDGIIRQKDADTIIDDIVEYLTKNDNGRNVAKRLGLKKGDIEEHAETVERMVREWTMGDKALAQMAWNHDADGIVRLVDQWVDGDPGALHPVHGFKADGTMGRFSPGSWAFDAYGKAIFELPTNKLSRQPFFRHWFGTYREALLKTAKAEGVSMDEGLLRQIDSIARAHALERVDRVLFDFRKQSRLGEMLWFVAPFYQPWSEAFMVWGHLLRKNPQFANRARILYDQMKENNWIRTDPATGETTVPLSNMWFMAPLLNMAFGQMGEKGFALSGPLQSLNFIFGSVFELPTGKIAGNVPLPLPSLNPGLMLFGQQLAYSDAVPDKLKWSYAKWAFQYGDNSQNFVGSLLPTYMQHAIRGMGDGPAGVGKVLKAAVGGDQIINSQADDFLRLYEAQGMTAQKLAVDKEFALATTGQKFKSVAAAQEYLSNKAMHQASQLSEWRAVMSMFMPIAPTIKFPTEDLETEYRRYITELGYDEGRDKFLKLHPENALITIGTTYWSREGSDVPLPANKMAADILSQPGVEEFAKENPQWVFAMLPDEVWGEDFDRALFFQQLAAGDRKLKTPMELQSDQSSSEGWDLYLDAKRDNLAELEHLRQKGINENDPAYQAKVSEFSEYTEALRTLYPGFNEQFSTLDMNHLDPWVEAHVDQALKSPLFASTQVGQFLKDYRTLRMQVMGAMEEAGIHSLKTVTAEKMGLTKTYNQGVKQLISTYGDGAERAYNYFFRDDLQSVVTDQDKLIDKLAADPEKYQKTLKWEKEWNAARETAANTSNDAKASQAYLHMRDMANQAYDLYGSGNDNPLIFWWKTRPQYEKDQYTASVISRPYLFLSRFEREEILGEKTDDQAEGYWMEVGKFDHYIAQYKQQHPNYDGSVVGGFYDDRDRMIRYFAKQSSTFATQVAHANEWGYSFFTKGGYIEKDGRDGEAWRSFQESLRDVQRVVVDNDLHGDTDFGAKKEWYLTAKHRLLGLVEYLKDYSPGFADDWKTLEASSPGPDLLDEFMPDIYYPLGG